MASGVPPAVFYRYSADRRGLHAEALLGTCQRFLHADAHSGFEKLYQPRTLDSLPALTEVACWAHARRKIYEVHHKTASPIAQPILEQIAALFAIEADIGRRPPEHRGAMRAEQA